eukprot:CAMPEP_0115040368 /NCGR_PEP_ID=MMETSP0216-20121206/44744_1 /TAXON_ID=223996 /ORGANISM="Protocruzia adherens, Strain Boccale" /LENGTH=885 /DNA_ID=CAMNT_0002421509 /DNA_START=281 /DNA_END=2935 /DNA_ORIENTATION=+
MMKLVVVRIMTPHRLIFSFQDLINSCLGPGLQNLPSNDLLELFHETKPSKATVLILTPGIEAFNLLRTTRRRLALKIDDLPFPTAEGIKMVFIPEVNETKLRTILKTAMIEGTWVAIENAHLTPDQLPFVDRIANSMMHVVDLDPNFRLWFTGYNHQGYPERFLMGVKIITLEMETSPKATVTRLLTSHRAQIADAPESLRYLSFALCLMHSLLVCRRKYGLWGWIGEVDYDDSDFSFSLRFLRKYEHYRNHELPMAKIRREIYSLVYGSKVTTIDDQRLVETELADFLGRKHNQPGMRYSSHQEWLVPSESSFVSFLTYLQSLSLEDSPSLYALHENADVNLTSRNSHEMIIDYRKTLQLSLERLDDPPSVEANKDQNVTDTAALTSATLPQQSSYLTVASENQRLSPTGSKSPGASPTKGDRFAFSFASYGDTVLQGWIEKFPTRPIFAEKIASATDMFNILLYQEQKEIGKRLSKVHDHLKALRKVLRGELPFTETYEEEFLLIAGGQIPLYWVYETEMKSPISLTSTCEFYVERLNFLQGWNENGIPEALQLRLLSRPKSFLHILPYHIKKKEVSPGRAMPSIHLNVPKRIPRRTGRAMIQSEAGSLLRRNFESGRRDLERIYLNRVSGEITPSDGLTSSVVPSSVDRTSNSTSSSSSSSASSSSSFLSPSEGEDKEKLSNSHSRSSSSSSDSTVGGEYSRGHLARLASQDTGDVPVESDYPMYRSPIPSPGAIRRRGRYPRVAAEKGKNHNLEIDLKETFLAPDNVTQMLKSEGLLQESSFTVMNLKILGSSWNEAELALRESSLGEVNCYIGPLIASSIDSEVAAERVRNDETLLKLPIFRNPAGLELDMWNHQGSSIEPELIQYAVIKVRDQDEKHLW